MMVLYLIVILLVNWILIACSGWKYPRWVTKRPIHFKLISNPDCDKPRIVIKRDYSHSKFNSDAKTELADLAGELNKRNSATIVPLVVHYEFKECWNLTLIETPGLVPAETESKGLSAEEIEAYVMEQARTPQRIVVGVEESVDWGKQQLLEQIKSIDPKFDRSVFVFTSLNNHIKTFADTKDANQYFSSTLQGHNDKAYFLTLSDAPEQDPSKFKEGLYESALIDIEMLEQLKFDRRFQNFIGTHPMRKHIWDATWKMYQDNIPSVQNRLRALKSNSEQTLEQLATRLAGMNIFKLRSSASNFVVNFMSATNKLIDGTLDGNPAQNGQTLAEEKAEVGEWFDGNGLVISLDESNLPHADTRIYGGQQFERLLAEFKAVAEVLQMESLPMDDIATAGGPSKLNHISSVAWSASDLARRAVHRQFLPLLTQLIKRASAIAIRLTDIATKMLVINYKKNKSRQAATGSTSRTILRGAGSAQSQDMEISPDEFPFYTHHVKELFSEFVHTIAEECREKCMDEFYCTRLIFWEQTNSGSASSKKDKSKSVDQSMTPESVQTLAQEIFSSIKTRITRNILLKCHNYFLVPIQSPFWGEIHGQVSVLPNEKLEELFEVPLTVQRLEDEQRTLQQVQTKFVQQEALFQTASHSFSHPVRA